MKQFLAFLLALSCHCTFSQSQITETQKTESLIHIWGLLKYLHPEVSKGTFDFNKEFISEFDKLQTISTHEELNSELKNWIKKFDLGKSKFKSNDMLLKTKDLFTQNTDFNWIGSSGFSTELIESLNTIKNNGNYGDYYASIPGLSHYPNFKNEKGMDGFDANKKSHRTLLLSSFWNVMRYWNVNIYLTDQKWDDVLTEMIPEFISDDNLTYQLAKDKLITKLNDSHADFESGYTLQKLLLKYPVFAGRVVNDSLVITTIRNKLLAKAVGISPGDVIVAAEGKPLKQYINDKFANAISASNKGYLYSRTEKFLLLAGTKDSVSVSILKKDGSTYTKYIKLYPNLPYTSETVESLPQQKRGKWQKLTDEIGYINLAKITNSELKLAFKEFEATKGIVIDLRNYPGNILQELTRYLYPEKKVYIKVLNPLSPGYAKYNFESPLRIVGNPFAAGTTNKNYYKGKIVLLVDRATGSHGENIAMAIQQAPNCVTIGEQTMGAVMNRKAITLIDKTTVDYTFAGAFYPDDTRVQRNGIKIDHIVKESAKNYNPDLYIEEAIKILN